MIFGEIDSALSIFERVRTWLTRKEITPDDNVASRLVRVFQAHGVYRNQIPRLLRHPLTWANIKDDETLLANLTDELLDAVANLFAIRREWLEGASEQIYPLHDFYKRPELFVDFIEQLRSQNTNTIQGVLLVGHSSRQEEDALIVLEETIGTLGEMSFCRYHLCNNWIFRYWKARAYLTAVVASAWRRKIHLFGRKVPIERIRDYREGKKFLEYAFDSALPVQGEPWYPEDMAIHPHCFLDGLDEGNYGHSEGLELWLELESRGIMDTGLAYAGIRDAFADVYAAALQWQK